VCIAELAIGMSQRRVGADPKLGFNTSASDDKGLLMLALRSPGLDGSLCVVGGEAV